jgi:long-chain acyl-CoA synthetase
VELQIRDPETGAALPDGKPGVVFTRGPQVMLGYYKDKAATVKVLDADGWFETGDLGFVNPGSGDLVLTGRAKVGWFVVVGSILAFMVRLISQSSPCSIL